MGLFGTGSTASTGGGGGGAPTGPAGGSLKNTYPNPGIAAGAVGTTELAALGVTTGKIALLAVTDAQVAAANKDGLAATHSMRTLGTGAQQAAKGSDYSATAATVATNTSDISTLQGTVATNTSDITTLQGTVNTTGATKLRETGGPTTLTIAAVADGQYLTRVGTTIVGSTPTTTTGQWTAVTGATTPTLSQADNTTNGATAQAFLVQAQNATGTTSTGGILNITSGTGTTAAGALNLQTGGTTRLSLTAAGVATLGTTSISQGATPSTTGDFRIKNAWTLIGRNAANSADLTLLNFDSSNVLTVGNNVGGLTIAGVSSILQQVGGTTRFTVTGTTITAGSGVTTFNATATNTSWTFQQATSATATYTGAPMTVASQDASGTTTVTAGLLTLRGGDATGGSGTRNGGGLDLRAGTGATANGTLRLLDGATVRLSVNGTGMAFYTATPVAQASRVGQLIDSTTGTPSTTLVDVGVAFSQANVNNNFASVLAKINGIESRISQAGGGVGVTA